MLDKKNENEKKIDEELIKEEKLDILVSDLKSIVQKGLISSVQAFR
jgi:hypothetical protein